MTDQDIIAAAKPYSMTAGNNLLATVQAVHQVDQGVKGDIVECGVWRGGHIIAAMLAASTPRTYWLFDTFDGMTEPGPRDFRKGHHATASSKFKKKGLKQWCRAELEEVKNNVQQFQQQNQTVHYIAGPVQHTLTQSALPSKIAVLRLDTDFYDSTKIELEVLWPRLVQGGILIVDDFHSWDGCRQACEEYFGENFVYESINNKSIWVVKQ